MSEDFILSYEKPRRLSVGAIVARVVLATICIVIGLCGLGMLGYGSFLFFEVRHAPSRDQSYYAFVGTTIAAIGLVMSAFGMRWLVNAILPKPGATIL